MRLTRKFDSVLILLTVFLSTFTGAAMISSNIQKTFATGEDETYVEAAEHFVTFYDEGEKLTVRTDARTVGEALERAGIVMNATDKVEPAIESEINSNNFFINIYRSRPVIVRVGVESRYIMTASYDAKAIATEAGVVVYDGDEIRLAKNTNFLETGVASVYEIERNGGRTVTEEVEIPFSEREEKDFNLAPGVKEVRQLGEVGTRVMTYEVQYVDGIEVERKLLGEEVVREPVERIVAVGASEIERHPLTAGMGVNTYTVRKGDGTVILRKETYYDLPMSGVMRACGGGEYTVREDGAKVDAEGYVLVAANLARYPRCSVVETSLGLGKVYDTGGFAASNPEQFDLATDWTNRDGR